MSKKVSEAVKTFLEEVLAEKIKQLRGIALDLLYYEKVIAGDNEDILRGQLEAEQNKRIVDRNGKITEDKRDLKKIQHLNERINEVSEASKKTIELQDMRRQLELYYKHAKNPDDKTLEMLEDIEKLIK